MTGNFHIQHAHTQSDLGCGGSVPGTPVDAKIHGYRILGRILLQGIQMQQEVSSLRTL